MNQKRILVPNGNYTDIRLIQALKKLGLYVITSGDDPNLEGHKYADEYVQHDYSDHEGMLKLAGKLAIDYVSACSNDFGVTTAAFIAENLGLPGHDTFDNARIIAQKDLFKQFAMKNEIQVIPSHWFYDIDAAVQFAEDTDYPIIVKPSDLGGGKGVSRVDNKLKAATAIKYAFDKSRNGKIVVEPFIAGTQHSITTFLIDRKVVSWITFNEFDSKYNRFLVGYTTSPADNMPEMGEILIGEIEKMAGLLQLTDGIFHVQYRMSGNKPLIMECMRRCLGNHSLKTASMLAGFEWEEWIAKAYCGLECGGIPRVQDSNKIMSHFYIQAPHNGIVNTVEIADELNQYMKKCIMRWKKGMVVHNYETEMLGFLFLDFPDCSVRDRIASKYPELVKVNME